MNFIISYKDTFFFAITFWVVHYSKKKYKFAIRKRGRCLLCFR